MNYLIKIIRNCKEATFLIEKKANGTITVKERLKLMIHLTGCSFCRLYKKQSADIDNMVSQLLKQSKSTEQKLDSEFKKELQALIEEKLKNN